MGDDDEGALVRRPAAAQVGGQPGDPVDVEVVGGLVEQHDVPVVREHGGEGDPAALAPAQVVDDGVPRDVAHEPRDDVADAGVAGPLVLRPVADDELGHGRALGERVGLVEHADVDSAPQRDLPGVGGDPSGEQPQQGRLAVAVAADHADPVTGLDADRDIVEDDLGRILEADALSAE